MNGSPTSEFGDLNAECRAIWDANAQWWDDKIGDGNAFQRELIEPATERLLQVRRGETILDVGCGAGRFARRMAQLGARVVAFDFSERFIARARQRGDADGGDVEYHVLDATNKEQILALGADRFDAAVATMSLMDIAAIEPLMGGLRSVLKPGGRLVYSVMHPCFQPGRIWKFAEHVEDGGCGKTRFGVKVTRYLTPDAVKGEGIVGQPELHYWFHRPLHVLFQAGFREGFVLDGLEEPAFAEADATKGGLRWRDLPEIPPVLTVRMILLEKREIAQ